MRSIVILYAFFLSSCYAFNHPGDTVQPVITLDANQQIYKASCSGLVEAWPDCLSKAKNTCKDGYYEIDNENIYYVVFDVERILSNYGSFNISTIEYIDMFLDESLIYLPLWIASYKGPIFNSFKI